MLNSMNNYNLNSKQELYIIIKYYNILKKLLSKQNNFNNIKLNILNGYFI